MNRHALDVLEFDLVLRAVAARAGSELGREALLSRSPQADLAAVTTELERVAEARAHLEQHPEWAPPLPPDARRALRVLEMEGGVLEAEDLLVALRLLQASAGLRRALDEAPAEDATDPGAASPAPRHLTAMGAELTAWPEEEARLERTVDDEGRIRDRASPELRSIRTKLRAARSRIVSRLEAYLRTLSDRIRVPDASVTVRDGRFVIPIRREGKSEVGGIIHGESGSGATLFVEPPLALRLMSELSELERDEAIEVERILRDASGRLRGRAGELRLAFEVLVDFDTLWARALTARAWDASRPEILPRGEEEFEVLDGRHPLLIEQGVGPVVPFFLHLEADERAMVVSGPNTGGKTVLLKAVGLLPLLAQTGIFPPVGPGSRLPIIEDVFADIGDEQSIAESLSTFSAHLANAREILEGAGPDTLVLMDEMGTGTDPAEGAALARALLETLVERGARAVVTSHLGAMKRLDRPGSGIVNASLLFDSERIEPTYQLQKGRPGRSYGLAIARRLGFPSEVLDRAESHLDEGEIEVEALLEQLEVKERERSKALAEAESLRAEAERERREAAVREAELRERERTAESRAREEARQLLLDARAEVEDAIRQVRASGAEDQREVERRARRVVEEAAEEQRLRRPSSPDETRRAGRVEVEPGARVRLLGSGTKGVVREVEDDRVAIEVGGLRLRVARSEVEVIPGASESEGPKARRDPARGMSSVPEVDVRLEADLRGLRVGEVDLELRRALDGAIMGDLHELRIIHGKGTGAVKARVQELLAQDPRVLEARPGGVGEGGAGVTVAVFR